MPFCPCENLSIDVFIYATRDHKPNNTQEIFCSF